jgi:beta-phosphoglucomutase-like phosphatase (HAD superfamily)
MAAAPVAGRLWAMSRPTLTSRGARAAGGLRTRRHQPRARAPREVRAVDVQPPQVPAPAPARDASVSLDALSARWRRAFDAAQDALNAAGHAGGSIRFAPGELPRRAAQLARERADTAKVIDVLAAEEHVHLVHRLSAPRATRRLLGLTNDVLALVFALDGVLTASADVHAAAWEETWDEFLAHRAGRAGERFAPTLVYNPNTDYAEHLHGRPRLEGVRSFLASRGITLPEGAPDDPPAAETVNGLANRKNQAVHRRLMRDGVAAFEGSRRYIEAAREAGLRIAVVSSSANTHEILERSGLAPLIDVCVDGNVMREQELRTRPAPDTFLAACRMLGVEPAQAAAFVTSTAGVAGLRAGGLGVAIAVNRAAMLHAEGADRVISDVGQLLDPALRA